MNEIIVWSEKASISPAIDTTLKETPLLKYFRNFVNLYIFLRNVLCEFRFMENNKSIVTNLHMRAHFHVLAIVLIATTR